MNLAELAKMRAPVEIPAALRAAGVLNQPVQTSPETPPRVVSMTPDSWSDTWAGHPLGPVDVGLRRISEHDQMVARKAATETADALHYRLSHSDPIWITAYNQAVMHQCLAFAMTHPENKHKSIWPMQHELVPMRLTTAGTERLYDELEYLTITTGPTRREAEDEELEILGSGLLDGSFLDGLSEKQTTYIRRLIAYVIEVALEPTIELRADDN